MQTFGGPTPGPACAFDADNNCPWGCTHGWSDGGGCPAGMETHNGETCEYSGCTDPADAANYDPKATFDDGSCVYLGCTNPDAYNFDQAATSDDGTCEFLGCTDEFAENYDPTATLDDGSCVHWTPGCTDSFAENYDPAATFDDGSCHYWTPETFEDATMDPAMMNGDWTAAGGR